MAPLIEVNEVWKKFQRGERHDTVRDLIVSGARRLVSTRRTPANELGREQFWALRGVSFSVDRGEAVAVIGPNGAGKSTLLKLLTRILKPTRGHCDVRGRIGALIEVAAGFHPDLTGRENVYLQGALMGMRRAEIARTFDAIVAFAGVQAFVDTPVKRYSSGMNARLGFAIAAHLDPDVLIVDEVLSVGDAGFQERCVARMRQLVARGVPLVFVSHNLPQVLQVCTRAVLLDEGHVLFDGAADAAVSAYQQLVATRTPAARDREGRNAPITITEVELLAAGGRRAAVVPTGAPVTIRVRYRATRPVPGPHIAVDLHRADGVYCCGINTRMRDCDLGVLEGAGFVDLQLEGLPLLAGSYSLSVGILDAHCLNAFDLRERVYPFTIVSAERERGVVHIEHAWRLNGTPCSPQPARRRSRASAFAEGIA
jgi:homopolymeric O-antigen transport system ATP-binding protein